MTSHKNRLMVRNTRQEGYPVGPARVCGIEPLEHRLLLAATLEFSGVQTLLAGTDYNVSMDDTRHQSEMQIAINPANPLNLIAMAHSRGISDADMDTWYSMDGGVSWTNTPIDFSVDSLNPIRRFDPTVAFDANGIAYIAYGARISVTQVQLIIARSPDGGQSYSLAFAGTPGNPDKFILVTGRDPSDATQQNVYVGFTDLIAAEQKVAVSTDGGVSFSIKTVHDDEGLWATPTVDADGRLYVVWDRFEGNLYMAMSQDAGDTFTSPIIVADNSLPGLGFGVRYKITAQHERGIRAVPSIAVNDGRIYLAYVTLGAGGGDNTDVVVRYSDDDGQNWTQTTVHSPNCRLAVSPVDEGRPQQWCYRRDLLRYAE